MSDPGKAGPAGSGGQDAPAGAPAPGPTSQLGERTGELLARLDGRPVAEHPATYEEVHALLTGALAGGGTRPAGGPASP